MRETNVVWQSPKDWRLEVVTLSRPDGQTEEKGIVRHPGAVALVPLTEKGEVLMLRQYRLALDQTILEIPAGTRGWEEEWRACAQRELREETGFRAGRLVELGDIWLAPGLSDEQMRLFVATELTSDPLPQDFDEQIELASIPLIKLVDMAYDGRLWDAKSVVALLRVKKWLEVQSVGRR